MDIGQAQRHKGNHRITFHCQQPNKERKISLEGPKKNDAPFYSPSFIFVPFHDPTVSSAVKSQLSSCEKTKIPIALHKQIENRYWVYIIFWQHDISSFSGAHHILD